MKYKERARKERHSLFTHSIWANSDAWFGSITFIPCTREPQTQSEKRRRSHVHPELNRSHSQEGVDGKRPGTDARRLPARLAPFELRHCTFLTGDTSSTPCRMTGTPSASDATFSRDHVSVPFSLAATPSPAGRGCAEGLTASPGVVGVLGAQRTGLRGPRVGPP